MFTYSSKTSESFENIMDQETISFWSNSSLIKQLKRKRKKDRGEKRERGEEGEGRRGRGEKRERARRTQREGGIMGERGLILTDISKITQLLTKSMK